MIKKVLIIGAGGIGSWLADMIAHAAANGQLQWMSFTIADGDKVEAKNLLSQNFLAAELGKNKAETLARRYGIFLPIDRKATPKDFEGYDLIISCVDNFRTRGEVFNYCHTRNKMFIDLRAEGSRAMMMTKGHGLRDDLDTVNLADTASASCQQGEEEIDYGNRIAAAIGMQRMLNIIRGKPIFHTRAMVTA